MKRQLSSESPLLSVIIPVYNVADYIVPAVNSVLSQTLDKSKTELIIVDDGSTDDTSTICKRFSDDYENIVYVRQNNKGVSSARNLGLKTSRGKYIHFFDGDDLLSKNFHKKSVEFLESHEASIDLVASKIQFFDAIIDSHPLNRKFHTTRVINLENEPNNPLLHMATCVFHKKAIENYSFDERLTISEDAAFLSEVLLDKKSYGVLKDTTYYYRKRDDETSAIGSKLGSKSYYLATPKYAYERMLEAWSVNGHVHPYMQCTLLYDLSYRLTQVSQTVLNSKEEAQYKGLILDIVRKFDDDSILKSFDYNIYVKLYLLGVKYDLDYRSQLLLNDEGYSFNGISFEKKWQPKIHIDFIHDNGDTMTIEGYTEDIVDLEDVKLSVSGELYDLKKEARKQREQSFLGDYIFDGGAFRVTFPLSKARTEVTFRIINSKVEPSTTTGVFTGLGSIRGAYRKTEYSIVRRVGQKLIVRKNKKRQRVFYELRFLLGILLSWRFDAARTQYIKLRTRNLSQLSIKAKLFELAKPLFIIVETVVMIPRALILRTGYFVAKPFKPRPIWLISDRGMAGGDNGEALYRYIIEQTNTPADIYFVISKKSADYAKLSRIGKVLDQGSLRYKLKFLLSDLVVSSHADIEVTNPFIRQIEQYQDLFNFKFVFLQHGVTKDDISPWLNRFEKNIALFITVSKAEQELILKNPFYYDKNQVVLTGFPRYDLLENDSKGKLILAPTYRKALARMKTDKHGARRYNPSFIESEYFRFYSRIMVDERLSKALQKHNITGEFYLHPALEAQRSDFSNSKTFSVMQYPYDYTKAFREGNFLVTDHSSVAFDFAYLKKPVVYAHFDIETFAAEHKYGENRALSSESDKFGPTCKTYEDLVEACVRVIESGCVMEGRYEKTVDTFFKYRDKNNSRRVYEELLHLNGARGNTISSTV